MTQTETPVARFLSLYAQATALDDIPAIVAHFADPFLSASPSGTQTVRVADLGAVPPQEESALRSPPFPTDRTHRRP